jgi:hypothetical protein
MNTLSLIQLVQGRLPGYDGGEYLREINDAYADCWNYILQLDDSYFTDVKVVTVANQSAEFDFLYNSNGALNNPISNRYFQMDRIRILQLGASYWYSAQPRPWNDPQMLGGQQLTPQVAALFPLYYYNPFAKGSVMFDHPLPVNTQIEVIYSFIYMPLGYLFNGTVTSAGTAITGTGTTFTQIVGADYQLSLPGNDQDTDIGLELIFANGKTYRLKTVTSDTAAVTITSVAPTQTAQNYTLAMVPDIPEGSHNVIATVATRNIMSTPGDDKRFATWAALAEKQLDMMRDTVMTRQRQLPARRQRFSQSVMRSQVSR